MDVKVGNRLADDVVDRHERAVGVESDGQRSGDPLDALEERSELVCGEVWQRDNVMDGHDEDVAEEHRAAIEEGNCDVVA